MTLLLWAIVWHQVCALAIPVGWLVPNLTLLGLLSAILRRPARWAWYGTIAAISVLLCSGSARAPQVMVLYGFIGWAVASLLAHLESPDRRVQTTIVVVAAALVTAGMLVAKGAMSAAIWGLGILHILITALALIGLRLVCPWAWPER